MQNFGFYVPLALCRSGPRAPTGALAYLAFLLWSLGILGVLWCFRDFTYRGRGTPLPTDPPRELVVSGLYRHVRNLIYGSMILILLWHFFWIGPAFPDISKRVIAFLNSAPRQEGAPI